MDQRAVATKASGLSIGQTFILHDQECLIVYTDYNNFGQRVIRFVSDTTKTAHISHMVVPHDFKFKILI